MKLIKLLRIRFLYLAHSIAASMDVVCICALDL